MIQIEIETTYMEGDVNVYVLAGDPVTLIDSGIPGQASLEQLQAGLAKHGLSLHDLQQIIVTHMHDDHCGGVADIQRHVDIPIYVHEQARRQLACCKAVHEQSESFFDSFIARCGAADIFQRRQPYRQKEWRHVRYVKDGDTVMAGGAALKVLYVPGHSQSDICLWNERTGDAFVGDYLLEHISANAFITPPDQEQEEREKPLIQLRESLRKTYDLSFQTIYPGHGTAYCGHRRVIDKRFTEQMERCERIYEHLRENPHSVYELSHALFSFLQGRSIFLGLSEIQGHLDLLEEQARAAVQMVGKVAHYRAI
ncbi:MBL fold metallo-hydrolase [Brevibacillus centrosporus]|uniref:Glyoxylase, beta-lactamase superfamily II n=1 Tax=Brevibacillus centrosporus TaxID=54910 RepID=A0A1I3LVD6_9BACL|nr:MBL fold metallo-hydrolase [Brevibacillus centrosporus]SFI88699.1 Glyoxylase, beta-lactamase superfamily II [Brevibacillus centrosporus]